MDHTPAFSPIPIHRVDWTGDGDTGRSDVWQRPVVDGRVQGHVQATEGEDATLTLSERGTIEGDVRVPNAILNGAVKGSVYVSGRLELASRARILGAIRYRALEMAAGAAVNGDLARMDESTPRLLGYTGEFYPACLIRSGYKDQGGTEGYS